MHWLTISLMFFPFSWRYRDSQQHWSNDIVTGTVHSFLLSWRYRDSEVHGRTDIVTGTVTSFQYREYYRDDIVIQWSSVHVPVTISLLIATLESRKRDIQGRYRMLQHPDIVIPSTNIVPISLKVPFIIVHDIVTSKFFGCDVILPISGR